MKKIFVLIIVMFMVTQTLWATDGPVTKVSRLTVCSGTSTVDIPVKVAHFSSVGSFSLQFTYDAAELTADTIVAGSLASGIAAWGTFSMSWRTPGSIIVSAYGPLPGDGVTLSDSTVLFTLRFAVLTTTSANISFVENTQGTSCEYTGVAPDYTPFNDTPASSFYLDGGVIFNNLTANTISSDQTICYNGTAGLTGSTVTGGTITYQWKSCDTENGTYTNVSTGGTGRDYTTDALTQDTWFKRTSTSVLNGVSCNTTSAAVKVTVNNLEAGVIAGDQTICSGGNPGAFTSSTDGSGDGTITYRWESNTNLSTPSWGAISGATASTYDVGVLTADEQYRRVSISTLNSVACEAISNVLTITVNQLHKISGTFTYYNTLNTVLSAQDVTVKLYLTSDGAHTNLLATDVTDASGYYEFTGLCPDITYDIVATSTHTTAGAVNTTDAAQVNYWFTSLYSIEKVRFFAGDVNGTGGSINATDALKIQQNFVYGTAFVNRPSWTFWKSGETTTVNSTSVYYPSVNLPVGSDAQANMYGLCMGDFNRSFNPALTKSVSESLQLVYGNTVKAGAGQEVDLPLRLVNASSVGAVSLVINFPAGLAEVKDVVMNSTDGNLDWTVNGNELRIGWNSPVAVDLESFDNLLTIKLKTTSAFTDGAIIRLELAANPLNELADDHFEVIGDAILNAGVVEAAPNGVSEHPEKDNLLISNYPNPFIRSTKFVYSLPVNGQVSVEIRNILGTLMTTLLNEYQARGEHSLVMNAGNLAPGIYLATIRVRDQNSEQARTIKIVSKQ
jgi:hypothetical protein